MEILKIGTVVQHRDEKYKGTIIAGPYPTGDTIFYTVLTEYGTTETWKVEDFDIKVDMR